LNRLKKIRTAYKVLQASGPLGICEAIGQKLINFAQTRIESQNLLTLDLLFRYATCNDLIQLMAKYPEYCFNDRNSGISNTWGLKQMGTLFCVEKITQIKPTKILEVGAGFNTFFDENFGSDYEYWMIDDAGYYPKDKFEPAIEKRQNTQFVCSLMGSFSYELPDNYFDIVFSISVLEHVPPTSCYDLYRDMFRVLSPGGYIVHSIDLVQPHRLEKEYSLIKKAGFLVAPRADLLIRVRHGEGETTLFEPIDIVFRWYFGISREDMWSNLCSIKGYSPTILVVAKKPYSTNG
jgi:ubiquinone/menaquinone biosynthesis C-methylase UbiE